MSYYIIIAFENNLLVIKISTNTSLQLIVFNGYTVGQVLNCQAFVRSSSDFCRLGEKFCPDCREIYFSRLAMCMVHHFAGELPKSCAPVDLVQSVRNFNIGPKVEEMTVCNCA